VLVAAPGLWAAIRLLRESTIDHWGSLWVPLTCLAERTSGRREVVEGGLTLELLAVARGSWQSPVAAALLIGAVVAIGIALWRWRVGRWLAASTLALLTGVCLALAWPLPMRLVAYDCNPQTTALLHAVAGEPEELRETLMPPELWDTITRTAPAPASITREEYLAHMRWGHFEDVNAMQLALLGTTASQYHRTDGGQIAGTVLLHDRWPIRRFAHDRPRLEFLTHALRYELWYLSALLLQGSIPHARNPAHRLRCERAWTELVDHPSLPPGLRPHLLELRPR
jgi:hypothetical protein